MNEIPARKSMPVLIAILAAVLCPNAFCAEHNATAYQEMNATIYEDLNATAQDGFNGTVYYLGALKINVTVPVNASRINLTLPEKVGDFALYDEMEKPVAVNSSYRFWQGNYIYSLNFGGHVKGYLIYNLTSQGQQFVVSLKEKGPVRIVLPEGYTTGDRLLGIAWPPPDETLDREKRSTLTWNNTTRVSYIEVNYYRKNAPGALKIVISILALAALALLIQYHFSIKRLRESRIRDEDDIKK